MFFEKCLDKARWEEKRGREKRDQNVLRVCLDTTYLLKTKNLLLKTL